MGEVVNLVSLRNPPPPPVNTWVYVPLRLMILCYLVNERQNYSLLIIDILVHSIR